MEGDGKVLSISPLALQEEEINKTEETNFNIILTWDNGYITKVSTDIDFNIDNAYKSLQVSRVLFTVATDFVNKIIEAEKVATEEDEGNVDGEVEQ